MMNSPLPPASTPRLLYCRCAYARVVPLAVKREVLHRLADSRVAFDAVPDLCEMSARKDPKLKELAASGDLKIAACFPRAVRWLFDAGGAPLAEEGVEICNMREEDAEVVAAAMLAGAPAEEVEG